MKLIFLLTDSSVINLFNKIREEVRNVYLHTYVSVYIIISVCLFNSFCIHIRCLLGDKSSLHFYFQIFA